MKKLTYKILVFCGLFGTMLSCSDKYETLTYNFNEPVMMSVADFRASVNVTSEQRKIENSGKICFYNGYLYIAENGKGIHIVDNRKPESPAIVGFIELLGNYDMAIRNNMLYADMFTELVWFNISNPQSPVTAGCMPNAFPSALPAIDNEYGYDYAQVYSRQQSSDSIIVGWKLTKRTERVEGYPDWWNNQNHRWDSADGLIFMAERSTYGSNKSGGSSQGVNGSMSSFALYNDYLYSVMNNQMTIISLAGATPEFITNSIYVGANVETLFSYKDAMFMGTPTGLLIYSVENPTHPVYCSQISHAVGCDPVVVENDLAYVTVHSGNICGQNTNELFVIDVSNIYSPQELVSYNMTSPKGLGIDNSTLFVCDDGLKIFNAANPQTIMTNRLAHKKGMSGYDVIPFNNVLMMIAEDGIYQYDYSDLNNIKQISKLTFQR